MVLLNVRRWLQERRWLLYEPEDMTTPYRVVVSSGSPRSAIAAKDRKTVNNMSKSTKKHNSTQPLIWTDGKGRKMRVWYYPDARPLFESPEAVRLLKGSPLCNEASSPQTEGNIAISREPEHPESVEL